MGPGWGPEKGDQLLSTLLTAPSRGRASMARPCQGWGSKPGKQTLPGQGDPSGTEGQSRKEWDQQNYSEKPQGYGGPHCHLVALLFYGWGIEGDWPFCSLVTELV